MCTVSMIGTDARRRLPEEYPWVQPYIAPNSPPATTVTIGVSRQEFDRLKAEVAELRELLKAAKRYDEATGQPDCEVEEKVAALKKIAELVGIDLSDVLA